MDLNIVGAGLECHSPTQGDKLVAATRIANDPLFEFSKRRIQQAPPFSLSQVLPPGRLAAQPIDVASGLCGMGPADAKRLETWEGSLGDVNIHQILVPSRQPSVPPPNGYFQQKRANCHFPG